MTHPAPLFTNDWFETSAKPVWDDLFPAEARRVLEIGSYEGKVPCYLMQREFAASSALEIHCVDPWEGTEAGVEERFHLNIAGTLARTKRHDVIVHKGRSSEVLPALLPHHAGYFDFCYVDGSHKAADVLSDAVLAFLLCRPGGIIAFDDYLWGQEHDLLLTPKIAVDSFLQCYKGRIWIVAMTNAQVWCQKSL